MCVSVLSILGVYRYVFRSQMSIKQNSDYSVFLALVVSVRVCLCMCTCLSESLGITTSCFEMLWSRLL